MLLRLLSDGGTDMLLPLAALLFFLSATAFSGEPVLPDPPEEGTMPVERALSERRSVRTFTGEPITPEEAAALLWSAQGRNRSGQRRTAPSAGATYPLVVDLVLGDVEGWEPGVYRYDPATHSLARRAAGGRLGDLTAAAHGQGWIGEGSVVIALSALYERTTRRYGERGIRYVHIEVGAAAENVHLQAAALGLGTTMVGAFDDEKVASILALDPGEIPLLLLPVGRPRGGESR